MNGVSQGQNARENKRNRHFLKEKLLLEIVPITVGFCTSIKQVKWNQLLLWLQAGPSGRFETIHFFHSLISFKMDKHPSWDRHVDLFLSFSLPPTQWVWCGDKHSTHAKCTSYRQIIKLQGKKRLQDLLSSLCLPLVAISLLIDPKHEMGINLLGGWSVSIKPSWEHYIFQRCIIGL